MGLGIFKSSSFSTNDGYTPVSSVEPRPNYFSIKNTFEVNGHLVAIIEYPNCTNFEGRKVLVYKNMTSEQLHKAKLLDPHFSKNGLSPFARFVPTYEGIGAAIELCRILK